MFIWRDDWHNLRIGRFYGAPVAVVVITTCFLAALAIHVYHVFSVDQYEFKPAAAEWHAAYNRRDLTAMTNALQKEAVAHCRTGDFIWFIHGADYCANALYR